MEQNRVKRERNNGKSMGKNELVRKSKEERCDRRKMELTSEKLKRSDCVLQKRGGKREKRKW